MKKNSNTYKVYKHTNKVDGKVYIGITKRRVEDRWQNGKGYTGQYFGKIINEVGWDNFDHEVLFDNLSKKEAFEKEIELIESYKSMDNKYGYNISKGGDYTCQEAKIKPYCLELDLVFESCGSASSYLKEKENKNVHERRIRYVCEEIYAEQIISGGYHWLDLAIYNKKYGTDYSFKVRQQAIKDIENNRIKKRSKPRQVICIESGIVYDNANIAGKALNISSSLISRVCKGTRERAGGYHWQFIDSN